MIIDIHTHPWTLRSLHERFVSEFRAASKRFGRVKPYMGIEPVRREAFGEVNPEDMIAEMNQAGIDKAVLLAFNVEKAWQSKISNEYIAELVMEHPEKFIGFASVGPLDTTNKFRPEAVKELKKAVIDQGLKGLKMVPTYDHYYPNDKAINPLYETALELSIPVLFHAGGTPVSNAPLKYANPVLMEDVALAFPELKIIVAHLGYPWTEQLLTLMRKQPNVYADISAMAQRPRILFWDLVMAVEYGVVGKILFGTDYPTPCSLKSYVDLIRVRYNEAAKDSNWPSLAHDEISGIMGENARKLGIA